MTTQTPAGWYPDPYGSPQLRWWDGNQWTDATHPTDAPPGQAGPTGPQIGPDLRRAEPLPGPSGPAGPPVAPGGPETSGDAHGPGSFGGAHGPTAPGAWSHPGGPPPAPAGPIGWGDGPGGGATRRLSVGYGVPPAPPRKSSPWPWILGGGGVVILIAGIVAAAMFLINPQRGTDESGSAPLPDTPTQEQSPPPATEQPYSREPQATPSPEATVELPRPENGRLQDPATGLSYLFPGSPWRVPAGTGTDPLGFVWTSAAVAMSHQDYDGRGNNWLGNIFTGELPDKFGYDGVRSLHGVAATLLHATEPVFYSPAHERKVIKDKAVKVGGKDGWLFVFELDFSKEAKANRWKWRKERAAFVIVDRGAGKRPALMYMSVPDNLDTSITDRVLDSLKIS